MAYENAKNSSTRDRLIRVALKLFAQHGFDATSTRMIAQAAGVNLSAISFHFSGKESLHAACLEFVADRARAYYMDISEKIAGLLEKERILPEEAYACLSEIVDVQLTIAFGLRYRTSLRLAYWEHMNAMDGYHPVTTALFEKVENSMAKLIAAVTDLPHEKALIASRFINGSIISFGEHSKLVQYALGKEDNLDQELHPWIRKEIARYCDVIIRDLLKL